MRWMKDPKTKEESVTVTMLSITFAVALVKLIVADMTFGKLTMGGFDGQNFALIVGTMSTLYWGRKNTGDKK